MPSDNVIPFDRIDQAEEAVQSVATGGTPEPSRRRLRWTVVALALVWAGAFGYALSTSSMPSVWMVAAFAAMVIAAEHRFVLFGDETSMSASIVIILCAVGYWAPQGNLVAPMIVATAAAFYLPHVRHRCWVLIAANGCSFGLASISAAAIARLTSSSSSAGTVVLGIAAVAAYWAVNSSCTGLLSSIRNDQSIALEIVNQFRSESAMALLALAGFMVGTFGAGLHHTPALLLVVVPMAAFESAHAKEFGRHLSPNDRLAIALMLMLIGATGILPGAGDIAVAIALCSIYLCGSLLSVRRFGPQSALAVGYLGIAWALLWSCQPLLAGPFLLVVSLAAASLGGSLDFASVSSSRGLNLGKEVALGAGLPSRIAVVGMMVSCLCAVAAVHANEMVWRSVLTVGFVLICSAAAAMSTSVRPRFRANRPPESPD